MIIMQFLKNSLVICIYEDNGTLGFSKYTVYIQSAYIFVVKRDTRINDSAVPDQHGKTAWRCQLGTSPEQF